jgi:hypothetical protein
MGPGSVSAFARLFDALWGLDGPESVGTDSTFVDQARSPQQPPAAISCTKFRKARTFTGGRCRDG